MRIPLAAPDIGEAELAAVSRVLRSSRLSLGPKLLEFENAVAAYTGVPNAVGVSSGTSGLHLCIRALGIGEGDEVIVPSFSFIAVANVVGYEKALPVFVDIDPETLCLDPRLLEAAVTARTRAIIAVHTFGCPAELSEISLIAQRYHLSLIEDACESIGAEYDRRKVGSVGAAGVFAFYPNKQITTGEGGVVVTREPEIAERLRSMRNQGRRDSSEWFQHEDFGYSYRLSEIHCALGAEQMKRIDSILERRAIIAEEYDRRLKGHSDVILPALTLPRRRISWFTYTVRLGDKFSQFHRDWIVREMEARGIGCGRYFAPIHLQPIYRGAPGLRAELPITERTAVRCLALPFFNQIRDEQMDEVCQTFLELLSHARQLPRMAGI